MTAAKDLKIQTPEKFSEKISERNSDKTPEKNLETLQNLAPDIWVAEQDFTTLFMGNIGTRMTVIRLPQNELFIHSPVQLTEHVRRDLVKLGTPRYVIGCSANLVTDLALYQQAFPSIKLFGTPVLLKKFGELTFYGTLTDTASGAVPENAERFAPWLAQIDQHFVSGAAEFEEVIFFHKKSKTLIVAELFCHLSEGTSWVEKKARQLFAGENCLRISRTTRRSLRAPIVRQKAAVWLDSHAPHRIIVNHGDVYEGSVDLATELLSG